MEIACVWTAWAESRDYPYSAEEERSFVEQLRACPKMVVPEHLTYRNLVTALVSALRSGVTVAEARRTTRGLPLSALAGVYSDLDAVLKNATRAWDRVVEDPSTFRENEAVLRMVVPQVVHELDLADTERFSELVDQFNEQILHLRNQVAALEDCITDCTDPQDRERLVSILRAPGDSPLDQPAFMPTRVGQLSAARVALLLGEAD